jgi:integrase/recombinase XerD
MTGLRDAVAEYLKMRRALGFKLVGDERLLMLYVGYCQDHAVEHVTTDSALAWASQVGSHGGSDEYWQSRKLSVVRIFARHLAALDPATEIPPADLLPCRTRRIIPYLYSPDEITALIDAAAQLNPPMRAATWRTVIGLLAVTGMRVGEICRLDRDHVDLDTAALVVEDSKFGKSRRLFLHPTTVTALREYAQFRDRCCPATQTAAFFVSSLGNRLLPGDFSHTFTVLLPAAAITTPPGRQRPRPHDLRHTFTVNAMRQFYRDGGDVQARLPILSTWLGHVDPASTYWYLQAVPERLALAAGRLENAFGGLS